MHVVSPRAPPGGLSERGILARPRSGGAGGGPMIKLGYHPATYQSQQPWLDRFLNDLAEQGWDGFEYAAGALADEYAGRESELRRALEARGLELSSIYTGCAFSPESVEEDTRRVEARARFAAALGCETILIDGGAKQPGGETEDDYRRVAQAANRVGQMAQSMGLACAWHQHWGSMFEYRRAFERLMALTDPQLVRF